MVFKEMRVRKLFKPAPSNNSFTLGYFQSAIRDGAGNFIRWADPESPINGWISNIPYQTAKVTHDEIHEGPPYKTGGDFVSFEQSHSFPITSGTFGNGTYYNSDRSQRYVGGFGLPDTSSWHMSFDSESIMSLSAPPYYIPDINPYGLQGWSWTKPKIETGSGYVFLAEREDIPRMVTQTAQGVRGLADVALKLKSTAQTFHESWGRLGGNTRAGQQLMTPNGVANQFLNHQFGWRPFLNDLISFDNVIGYYHNLVNKLTKENGQPVRSRKTLKKESNTSLVLRESLYTDGYSYGLPCFPQGFLASYFSGPPQAELYETTSHHVWAVGNFTYYRPEFDSTLLSYDSAWSKAMRLLAIAGLRPSPSNIYKAIPWTWLYDWAFNLGLYVDYLSDVLVDSVVANYFAVMQTRTVERKFILNLPFLTRPLSWEGTRIVSLKQRQMASSPFDFGLTWNDLSPRQLAILAALKITRS